MLGARSARTIEERILVPASIAKWKAGEATRQRAFDVQLENQQKFQKAFSRVWRYWISLSTPKAMVSMNWALFLEVGLTRGTYENRCNYPAELHMPLVRPFETSFGVTRNRRIVLAEIQSEGLTGWGECTAGERPFFSGESTTPRGSDGE